MIGIHQLDAMQISHGTVLEEIDGFDCQQAIASIARKAIAHSAIRRDVSRAATR